MQGVFSVIVPSAISLTQPIDDTNILLAAADTSARTSREGAFTEVRRPLMKFVWGVRGRDTADL